MTTSEETVADCHDLVHQGRVTEQVSEHGLFWIMDELTGGRRLLDRADLEIGRAPMGIAPRDRAGELAAA